MTFELPAHGVAALLMNDAGPEPESLDGSCAVYYQCAVRLPFIPLEGRILTCCKVSKWHIHLQLGRQSNSLGQGEVSMSTVKRSGVCRPSVIVRAGHELGSYSTCSPVASHPPAHTLALSRPASWEVQLVGD